MILLPVLLVRLPARLPLHGLAVLLASTSSWLPAFLQRHCNLPPGSLMDWLRGLLAAK